MTGFEHVGPTLDTNGQVVLERDIGECAEWRYAVSKRVHHDNHELFWRPRRPERAIVDTPVRIQIG